MCVCMCVCVFMILFILFSYSKTHTHTHSSAPGEGLLDLLGDAFSSSGLAAALNNTTENNMELAPSTRAINYDYVLAFPRSERSVWVYVCVCMCVCVCACVYVPECTIFHLFASYSSHTTFLICSRHAERSLRLTRAKTKLIL